MTDTDVIKYFIEYQEPGFAKDEWVRMIKTRATYKKAFESIQHELRVKHPEVKFRIRREQMTSIVLWSMEDEG